MSGLISETFRRMHYNGLLVNAGQFNDVEKRKEFRRESKIQTEEDFIACSDQSIQSCTIFDVATRNWIVWFKYTLYRVTRGLEPSVEYPPEFVEIHEFLKSTRAAPETSAAASAAAEGVPRESAEVLALRADLEISKNVIWACKSSMTMVLDRQRQRLEKFDQQCLKQDKRIRELEAREACAVGGKRERDVSGVVDKLEELNQFSLVGRPVQWLRKVKRSAKAFLENVQAAEDKAGAEVPDSFCCPISQAVMEDPVILVETGHSYDRKEIDKWLALDKKDDNGVSFQTDPCTGKRLTKKPQLIQNHALRKSIAEHRAANAVGDYR
jgi:hypothetical protein